MPPGPRCTKCHQIAAAEGDSWCTGCSAWEFLGRELTASWDSEGARVLAGDLAVTAARQVKALRSLSSGLARVAGGPSAGTGRGEVPVPAAEPKRRAEQPHTGRDSLPRRRAPLPPPPLPPKEEESEEGEESEEETRDRSVGRSPAPDHRPLPDGSRRPPEPDTHRGEGGDRRESRRARDAGSTRASDRSRRSRKREHREHRDGHSSRRGRTRGGRKHQRLKRLAVDPTLRVHRKPAADFWELTSTQEKPLECTRLGY